MVSPATSGIAVIFPMAGVFAMVPAWWRHRRIARRLQPADAVPDEKPAVAPPLALESGSEYPPRDGL